MEDRRKGQRGPTYLAAQIAFNGRASTIDCLVKNLSSQGAKIAFGDGVAIPVEFDVTIRRRAETRRARIMWRNETQAGIHFLRPVKETSAGRDDLARRVTQLGDR